MEGTRWDLELGVWESGVGVVIEWVEWSIKLDDSASTMSECSVCVCGVNETWIYWISAVIEWIGEWVNQLMIEWVSEQINQ